MDSYQKCPCVWYSCSPMLLPGAELSSCTEQCWILAKLQEDWKLMEAIHYINIMYTYECISWKLMEAIHYINPPTRVGVTSILILLCRAQNVVQNPNPKSKLRNPKSKIRNPKSKIRNPKSKIQNPKSKIRNPKSKIQNPKSKIRNPKSKIQNPKSKIQNPKSNICTKRIAT